MLNINDILETVQMIQDECLDIRTITMGISLLDCADSDIDKSCQKVYDKITRYAKDLVPVCNRIEHKYGIPIINTHPIGIAGGIRRGVAGERRHRRRAGQRGRLRSASVEGRLDGSNSGRQPVCSL